MKSDTSRKEPVRDVLLSVRVPTINSVGSIFSLCHRTPLHSEGEKGGCMPVLGVGAERSWAGLARRGPMSARAKRAGPASARGARHAAVSRRPGARAPAVVRCPTCADNSMTVCTC